MTAVVRPTMMVEGSLVTWLDTGYRVEVAIDGDTFVVYLDTTPTGRRLTIVEPGSVYGLAAPSIALDALGRLRHVEAGYVTPRYLAAAAKALRALELDGVL